MIMVRKAIKQSSKTVMCGGGWAQYHKEWLEKVSLKKVPITKRHQRWVLGSFYLRTLFSGLLPAACLACLLAEPRTTCLGVASPMSGWTLSHQSLTKTVHIRMCSQTSLMEVIPQWRFPLPWWLQFVPRWQKLTRKLVSKCYLNMW